MYLKSIEMQGFKSFANKMVLEFHDGITGIVGPNGSGKSNVADAVRWVLGEQSAKQLRGGNMQDVIFSGTELRKPLGFASVAITLDNTDHQLNIDYEEVTVTRRLYRSGDSEYLMNGRICRLKDVQELFYDTGIGKEGYSIIGQGQIDKILSGKPDDRRELFDEAAGIVKFKRRKNATLKKLNEEESNLVRVTDILSELSRQVGPLERQSEKARVYLEKREMLRDYDINLFLTESERLEGDLASTKEKLDIAENHLEQLTKSYEETKVEYEELETKIAELDEEINHFREQASEDALRKQQLENQIALFEEQINSAKQNASLFEDRKRDLEENLKKKEADYQNETEQKEALVKELDEKQRKKAWAEEAHQEILLKIEAEEKRASEKRAELLQILNERSFIKGKLQRFDAMLEQAEIRKSELTARMLRIKGSEDQNQSSLQDIQEAYRSSNKKVEEQRKLISDTQTEITRLQSSINEKSQTIEELQTKYHRQASRLESLNDMTEKYEGYGNSIRKVMEQKDNNPGIHGVVADLIQTEEKYEAAIETALGGALQNIVTDNESTAKYLIEYLKRGRFGRATFLPLTAMTKESGSISSEILKEIGVIGAANALSHCAPAYKNLMDRLLGKTLVVANIDHAIRIGRKYKHSVRMVTLEGDLLNPGGSMTGGAFKNNHNLLGRRREIEDLEKSVRTIRRQLMELQDAIEEERSKRNALRDQQSSNNELLQRLCVSQNTAKLNLETAETKAGELKEDYRSLQIEGNEIEKQMREVKDDKRSMAAEMETSLELEKAFEAEITGAEQAIIDFRQQEKELLTMANEASASYAACVERGAFCQSTLQNLEEEIARLKEEFERLQLRMSDDEVEVGQKEQDILRTRETIQEAEKQIKEKSVQFEQSKKEREALSKQHKELFRQRDQLADEKAAMDKECFTLSSKLQKLEEHHEAQISYLWEEYQITPDQTEKYAMEERPEVTTLKRMIKELKDGIKALGPVNVNAIEEYKEVKERYTFLSAQHEDLTKASDTLKGIIAELDQSMRRQFAEKFEAIRVEFDTVFKQLFGGGHSTLELVEDEDILEAGIRIISQPPGKKLQNMMQLSGGEKALTAIALMFAIQNLKPSPFCLLDEIEAALDESNVVRFAKYLHKLTKNTQFIVITHRRGTMTAADRLYGITMQEKGVSALVSVNLIEEQLDK